MPFPAKTDFDTICGCLRLSHKYGVDYLRRRALIHLSSRHPTTLSDWEAMIAAPRSMSWERPEIHSYTIFLLQLVREVDAPWIIPYAFYVLCYSFEAHLGTGIFYGTIYKDVPVSLAIKDQESFLRGYYVQKESAKSDILRFLFSPARILGCTDVARCIQVRLAAFDAVCQKHSGPGASTIPLHFWPTKHWTLVDKVCSTCRAYLKKTHQDACQAFWDKLPEIYGLPPWGELEKMKTDAIGSDLPGSTCGYFAFRFRVGTKVFCKNITVSLNQCSNGKC